MKAAFAIIVALLWPGVAFAGPDEDVVRQLLHDTFDKPEARLVVEPVVVAEGYAIAGWTQAEMGGRALLRHRQGGWVLILCAGDGIRSPEALRQAGIASGTAQLLSDRLAEAERLIAPERLAMFARFEGLVKMDESGHHPPVPHKSH